MLISFPENPEKLTAFEKMHIPAVWLLGSQIKVTVGEKPHLMMPNHFIEWIELYDGEECLARVELRPQQKAEFIVDIGGRVGYFKARALCSPHGLWQSGWR